MGSCQHIIRIVIGKQRGLPSGAGGMAGDTFSRNTNGFVVGIYGLVVIILMAAGAGIGCVRISIDMTSRTSHGGMCPG